jgi:hypothetical protein
VLLRHEGLLGRRSTIELVETPWAGLRSTARSRGLTGVVDYEPPTPVMDWFNVIAAMDRFNVIDDMELC